MAGRNKGKPVHTGLYLVRKGMRLDGATLSFFIAFFILHPLTTKKHTAHKFKHTLATPGAHLTHTSPTQSVGKVFFM